MVRSAACFYRALQDRLTVGDVAELQSCADRFGQQVLAVGCNRLGIIHERKSR